MQNTFLSYLLILGLSLQQLDIPTVKAEEMELHEFLIVASSNQHAIETDGPLVKVVNMEAFSDCEKKFGFPDLLTTEMSLQKLGIPAVTAKKIESDELLVVASSNPQITDTTDSIAEMADAEITDDCKNKSSSLNPFSKQLVSNNENLQVEVDSDIFPTCPIPVGNEGSVEELMMGPVDIAFRFGLVPFIFIFCMFLLVNAFDDQEVHSSGYSEVTNVRNVIRQKRRGDTKPKNNAAKKMKIEAMEVAEQVETADKIKASTRC